MIRNNFLVGLLLGVLVYAVVFLLGLVVAYYIFPESHYGANSGAIFVPAGIVFVSSIPAFIKNWSSLGWGLILSAPLSLFILFFLFEVVAGAFGGAL